MSIERRSGRWCAAVMAALCTAAAGAQQEQPKQAHASPERAAAKAGPIPGILAEGTDVVRVHGGLEFTEGPAADGEGNIYFTDLRTSKIHIARADGTLATFMEDSRGCNGLMFDARGRLVACQAGAGRVIAIDPATRAVEVLAEKCGERPLGRLNDLVIDAAGGVYFSDPELGRREEGVERTEGVYYVSAAGDVSRVIGDLPTPNGVLLSADGATLYVLPYTEPRLMAYAVEGPGRLGAGGTLCELQSPAREGGRRGGGDGLTVDERGNLYVAVPSARLVQVVSADGKTLGTIPVPEGPSNCVFGGEDNRTLFITARTGLYSVRLLVAGLKPWPARAGEKK